MKDGKENRQSLLLNPENPYEIGNTPTYNLLKNIFQPLDGTSQRHSEVHDQFSINGAITESAVVRRGSASDVG
jgi:hypothetical protein